MLWRGQRESDNVVDRRGIGATGIVGGGTILVAVVYALLGGDPRTILDRVARNDGAEVASQPDVPDEQKDFVRVVLADTEDVWGHVFSDAHMRYEQPKLVLYSDQVDSACGMASSAVGPFYCPRDHRVYLDLSFFQDLSDRMGARGDFARAYVIAHEIGHHVQTLLGQMPDTSDRRASVRTELQADCLAGVWAKRTDQEKHILENGDVEEALDAAAAVGDDRLQQERQGYVVPDSFTHGSSAQRVAAFKQGFVGGDLQSCGLNTVAH